MPTKCEICKGHGVLHKGTHLQTCKCRVIASVRRGLDYTPQFRGVKPSRDLVDLGLDTSATIVATEPRMHAATAGWVATRMLRHEPSGVRFVTAAEVLQVYRDNGELGEPLVVFRAERLKNKLLPVALMNLGLSVPRLWIYSTPGSGFGEGHPAWDSDLASLIDRWPHIELDKEQRVDDVLDLLDGGAK